jgi:hypothetical protein
VAWAVLVAVLPVDGCRHLEQIVGHDRLHDHLHPVLVGHALIIARAGQRLCYVRSIPKACFRHKQRCASERMLVF